MNRYTQISPSQFQPLSLQEIMLVPTLKRQQHDAAIAGMEQLRDLKADPLKVHEERALQIKSDFENKINEKVEQLNSQGYNPSIVSDLSRLNKEYRDLISPTGEIGKINQAKKVRNQMYDEWLKNKDYDKYGSNVMQGHWNRFEGAYTGFDSEGNITNIGAMSSPAYEDLDEDLKTRFKGIGHIARDIMSGGIGLSPQADGSMLIVNSKTGEKSKVNDPQIQAELNDFYLKWVDPRGSGYKSLTFAGVDPNYAYQRAMQKGVAATIDEYGRTNTRTGSLQGYKRPDDMEQPLRPFEMTSTYLPSEVTKNYAEGLRQISELQSKKTPLTPQEEERLAILQYNKQEFDEYVKEDSSLSQIVDKMNEKLAKNGMNLDQYNNLETIVKAHTDMFGNVSRGKWYKFAANEEEADQLVQEYERYYPNIKKELDRDGKTYKITGTGMVAGNNPIPLSVNNYEVYLDAKKNIKDDKKVYDKKAEDFWQNQSIQTSYQTSIGAGTKGIGRMSSENKQLEKYYSTSTDLGNTSVLVQQTDKDGKLNTVSNSVEAEQDSQIKRANMVSGSLSYGFAEGREGQSPGYITEFKYKDPKSGDVKTHKEIRRIRSFADLYNDNGVPKIGGLAASLATSADKTLLNSIETDLLNKEIERTDGDINLMHPRAQYIIRLLSLEEDSN